MSTAVDFYLLRAADCARDARETGLVNVRERALRAEAAWRTMADRLIRVEEQKRQGALVKSTPLVDDPASVPWPIAPYKAKPKRTV